MNNPEISIIIPVYNSEKYLRRTLDSVLNQEFQNFEVIMINDGSSDSSLEIMEEFEKKFNMCQIINTKNQGVSAARNIGIKYSRGKYLSFIDSDDFVHPSFLKVLYNSIKKYDADIACCNHFLHWEKSNICFRDILFLPSGLYSSEKILKFLISDVRLHYYIWNKLWKKSLFIDNQIEFQNMCFEDIFVSLRLFYFANNITVDSSPLYYYNIRSGSTVNAMNRKKYNDYITAFALTRNFLEIKKIYNKYKFYFLFLGCRIILSSFNLLRSINPGIHNLKNFISDFKSSTKNIIHIMSNRFKCNSELEDSI